MDSTACKKLMVNKMELRNGVIDYNCKKYKTKIDLNLNKFVGKQYIQYASYNYYGTPDNVKVTLKWKKRYLSDNKNSFEWIFLPKITTICGYFKVSRIEEKSNPEDYMNTKYIYSGRIKNFMRDGFGTYYDDTVTIEALWEKNYLNGYFMVKAKNKILCSGRLTERRVDGEDFIFDRNIVDNINGSLRFYEENGKLLSMICFDEKSKSNTKKFEIGYFMNGQMKFIGELNDGHSKTNGSGACFIDNQGRANNREFGNYVEGKLHGHQCYQNINGIEKFGCFIDGIYQHYRNG